MTTIYRYLFPFLLSALFACGNQESKHDEIHTPMNMRFLALGDSYTIGEGVEENERWPNQLRDSLSQTDIRMDAPMIIARTGWTTAELKAGIETANPEGPFDLVSLLIGVNNQYRGPDRGYTPEGYREEFAELLQMAIGFAGGDPGRVLVVSIPDYGVTPFLAADQKERVGAEIDRYNAINLQESGHAGVLYADITPISRLAAERPGLIASDRLHPSGEMYALWVEAIIPVLKAALEDNHNR